MGNTELRAPQGISGTAARAFGNVFVPTSGTATAQIMGDVLQTTVKSGLEKKELFIRIQNIDSIEITEAPIYALLSLGISIVLASLGAFSSDAFWGFICLAVGLVIVVWAIQKKRRLLIIYSLRSVVPIYMNRPPEEYQQFTTQVMAIARRLNASPPQIPQTRQNGQISSRQNGQSQRRATSASK